MTIRTDEHEHRFCNEFSASRNPYDPEWLTWPDLDNAAPESSRAMPFSPEMLHIAADEIQFTKFSRDFCRFADFYYGAPPRCSWVFAGEADRAAPGRRA